MSKKYRDRQTEKITRTHERKEKITRTFERIRMLRPKSHILKVPFPISVSVSVSVSGTVSVSVSVVRGIAPYI